MIRRHRGSSSSSSDEEDAFSVLSRKQKKSKKDDPVSPSSNSTAAVPSSSTLSSSAKRHHHVSSERAMKMDLLWEELQADKSNLEDNINIQHGSGSRQVPEKKGSFVEEGEEHLTTNIFVGNLCPSTTEEALTDLYRQFGDLYSVKIMWPRTQEERARNRNTGFVCFMRRDDAQEAMDAFNDADPFGNGRRMVLRWGKNVKKTVKRGTGGVPIPPIKKKQRINTTHTQTSPNLQLDQHDETQLKPSSATTTDHSSAANNTMSLSLALSSFKQPMPHPSVSFNSLIYDPILHSNSSIHVIAPQNSNRTKFITTVAKFVSTDGSLLERKLISNQSSNPEFSFLLPPSSLSDLSLKESIYYRWRVYAFSQNDGINSWRTQPFLMLHPHGQWWIPPPLMNVEAAIEEQQAVLSREKLIRDKMEERRRISSQKNFMTGRQLEHAKFGTGSCLVGVHGGGDALLNEYEKEQFNLLLKNKLCSSKESICEAMSFCFDKSGAAKQICEILEGALLQMKNISVETKVARLFLLSDILFNSQQPGVRNAFRYRDAIYKMSPTIFTNLGKINGGRMTKNKLRMAVRRVLKAWMAWSVYNVNFIQELEANFEGRDYSRGNQKTESDQDTTQNNIDEVVLPDKQEQNDMIDDNASVTVVNKPRGGWTDVESEPLDDVHIDVDMDGEPLNDIDVDGESLVEYDIDGESLNDIDVDGVPLGDDDGIDIDIDGEQFEDYSDI